MNETFQQPKPRRSFGLYLFVLLLVIVALIGLFALTARYNFSRASGVSSSASLTISQGETVTQLAADLAQQKLIPSAFWFKTYLRLHPSYAYLHTGAYQIPAHAIIRQIALQLQSNAKQQSIRVPEGATVNDIAATIASNTSLNITKAQVIAAEDTLAGTYNYFGENTSKQSLEGYLFPDTYFIGANDTAQSILQKMLDNENQKITPTMLNDIRSNNMTVYQTITLASLIEKEIGTTGTVRDPEIVQQERKIVAGIIYNRLQAGMPLQFDSTKTYVKPGTVNPDPSYDTYVHAGLPPGPISNPSLDSIEAAIYPTKSDYLYFITDKSGTAHFAKTLQEQDVNIQQYLNNQ